MKTLTLKSASSLSWFARGHYIDMCIDISNKLGLFFPSDPLGETIKQGQIQALFVRGLLMKELTESFGISYWRFRISALGQQYVEAHKNVS
jgi:hypothetical protein